MWSADYRSHAVHDLASEITETVKEMVQSGVSPDQLTVDDIIRRVCPGLESNAKAQIPDVSGKPIDVRLEVSDGWVIVALHNKSVASFHERGWHAEHGWETSVSHPDTCFRNGPRRRWKKDAVGRIGRLAGNPEWVAGEITALRSRRAHTGGNAATWFSDAIILLRNGEWVVYAHLLDRVRRSWLRRGMHYEMLVGEASDGKWYYSSLPLNCQKGRTLLVGCPQPADLGAFVKEFHLEEFDGKSDQALQETSSW